MMKSEEPKLPPMWITGFSYFFVLYLLFAPLFAAINIARPDAAISASIFGLELEGGNDPLGWQLALYAVLFLAALTALLILTKNSFAYFFGIVYCFAAFGFAIAGHLFVGAWDRSASLSGTLQLFFLVCFFVHLLRNRKQWEGRYASTHKKAPLEEEPQT